MPEPAPPAVAYVAVGSNIEPHTNVPRALELLRRRVEVVGVSTFYRTAPLGGAAGQDGQGEFLNGVFQLRATCGARKLKFQTLRPIERALGRVRTADRCAPRTIDLDLVLYGDEVIDEPDLKIPAPDIDRPFVAVPLLELAPDLVLPHTRQPLSCLWGAVDAAGMAPDAQCTRALKEAMKR